MTYAGWWLLIVLAVCGLFAFTLAALVSGEWRYLVGTLVCGMIIRPLFP